MYLWIAMCMRAQLAHVDVEISDHSPNFLDTPCRIARMEKQSHKEGLTVLDCGCTAVHVVFCDRYSYLLHH